MGLEVPLEGYAGRKPPPAWLGLTWATRGCDWTVRLILLLNQPEELGRAGRRQGYLPVAVNQLRAWRRDRRPRSGREAGSRLEREPGRVARPRQRQGALREGGGQRHLGGGQLIGPGHVVHLHGVGFEHAVVDAELVHRALHPGVRPVVSAD